MKKYVPGRETMIRSRRALLDHNVLIDWKREYELGIPIIDEQHRGIVTTINSLYYAIQDNHGTELLEPVINMICEYTRIHFDVEEEYLKRCNFSEQVHHQQLHTALKARLTKAWGQSMKNLEPQVFLEFLKDWWIDHICDKDRVFRDYIVGMKCD